jgi:RNA polymerase-binding protein DksA
MSLTTSQLSSLGKTLDAQYVALLEEVRDELDTPEHQQYVELIDRGPGDGADVAIGAVLADMQLTLIDRHVRELRDIEATLARVRDGSFGTCCDCGADIAFARLQAYPTARRCVACQGRREKLYASEVVPAP